MSATDTAPAMDGLPPLRQVIADHELGARKALGQNFLLDLNLTGRIARAAGPLDDGTVIEIGPGPGGLTRALLYHGAARLVVIERDRRCLPVLAEIAAHYPGRLTVIEADALTVDPTTLGPGPRRIVANLPYNVGTALLLGWLAQIDAYDSLTLMFQKEVAARITAGPNSKAYGRLSVLCQWLCDCRALFDVHRSAFTPPPKVTSAVVQLRPRPRPADDPDTDSVARITQAAFGQRRKMLRRSLAGLPVAADRLLTAAGLDGTRRAESLDIDDFLALARALAAG